MKNHSWAGIAADAQAGSIRAAAAVGILLQVASGFAVAQNNPTTGTANGSVPGIPTTPYTRPNDSSAGVTQATSNKEWRNECATGTVLSGGTCIPLPTTPSCSYGQVWTGGACAPIGSFTPPTTSCGTGTVLSGGICVPMSGPPAGPPPSCPAQPTTSQVVPCPSGQNGSIQQTRSATCNASTGWSWQMGSWGQASSTCAPAPSPTPTCPAQPTTSQTVSCPSGQNGSIQQTRSATCNAATGWSWQMGSWAQTSSTCTPTAPPPQCSGMSGNWGWGAGCIGYSSVGATSVGGSHTIYDSAGRGSYTFVCSVGGWTPGSFSCTPPPPPPPPPPPQCAGVAGPVSWGPSCNGYVNAPNTPVGGSYSITSSGPGSGSISWICGAGGNWAETSRPCSSPASPPPGPTGCPATTISSGQWCPTAPVPYANNGQSVPINWGDTRGTMTCSNGSWSFANANPWGCY